MPSVTVYATPFCPYCHRAKRLLQDKGVTFQEIDVFAEPRRRREMTERAGGRTTVPQIFIDETHIGGCDDLMAAEKSGRLDTLLAGNGAAG